MELPADLIKKSAGFSMDIGNLEKYFLFNESVNKELLSNKSIHSNRMLIVSIVNPLDNYEAKPLL